MASRCHGRSFDPATSSRRSPNFDLKFAFHHGAQPVPQKITIRPVSRDEVQPSYAFIPEGRFRAARQRTRRVLGMLSSLGVQVPRPT
jgi:hypothetical protein